MNAIYPSTIPDRCIARSLPFFAFLSLVMSLTACKSSETGKFESTIAMDPEPVKERVDAATTSIITSFNENDRAGFVEAFSGMPFILADGAPIISGTEGVSTMYVRTPEGMVYEPMLWGDRNFYAYGPWIIETGLVEFRYRMYASGPVLGDPRQVLTIWESTPDNGLKVKLLSWNRLVDRSVIAAGEVLSARADLRDAPPVLEGGDFTAVLDAERIFHADYPTRNAEENSAYYAEDALLILPGILPLRGAAAIRQHMKEQPLNPTLVNVEQEVLHVEGNDQYVLVLNRFNWTFRTGESVPLQTLPGKGVHVWRKGSDGTWRILFDLPNVSVPGL